MTHAPLFTGRNPNEVTADKYNENKSTIVTKQAVTSNMTAVQKSSIPDSQLQQHAAEAAYQDNKGSFITISSQDKSTSPMDQLLQKESSLLKSRAKLSGKGADLAKNDKKDNGAPSVSDKIQDLSEHLKKVDDKGDMTALEENETSSVHPKVCYDIAVTL